MSTTEPLGSAAEEAARLVAAAQQWWSGHPMPQASPCEPPDDRQVGPDSVVEDQAGPAEHPTTCRSCPWCRARTLLAGVSPEVVEHLAAAATSLAAAVRELHRPEQDQNERPDQEAPQ